MTSEPITPEQRKHFILLVSDLQEDQSLQMVIQRLEGGDDPLNIVEDCQEGLRLVGERYERREYYLSGLIMAGEIFREAMELLSPVFETRFQGSEKGAIVLGTVAGDIHDIGKNNLSLLLTCYGFTVYDLGVDVSAQSFLQAAAQLRPDIIGLSGLLTSSYDSMKKTVETIRTSADPRIATLPVILGGNQLNQQVCDYVGADGWVTDAMSGVRLAQKIISTIC